MSGMVGPTWTALDPLQGSGDSEAYLEGVRALPTLPSILFRFLGLIADPTVSVERLADFIYKDPALLARVIPLVNASSSAGSLPPAYWKQAIALLGKERIRNLAFTTPLLRSFEPTQAGFNSLTYWERSLLCAHAWEVLARQLCFPGPEQFYVAGLLHDIGHLLFLQKRPAALQTIIERMAAKPGDLQEAESSVLGIDHCQLGFEVATRLNLDPWIRHAIRDHHLPSADSDPVTLITCIGSAFCHYKGMDFFPSPTLPRPDRQPKMEEIIHGLLPSLPEEAPAQLLAAMEQATQKLQGWISEIVVDFHSSGESFGRAMIPPPEKKAAAVSFGLA